MPAIRLPVAERVRSRERRRVRATIRRARGLRPQSPRSKGGPRIEKSRNGASAHAAFGKCPKARNPPRELGRSWGAYTSSRRSPAFVNVGAVPYSGEAPCLDLSQAALGCVVAEDRSVGRRGPLLPSGRSRHEYAPRNLTWATLAPGGAEGRRHRQRISGTGH